MSDWKPYLNDRLIRQRDGFVVIRPIDCEPPVPLSCPLCFFLFRDKDDEQAYHEFNVCARCAMVWAYPNKDVWKEGWRPSKEEVEAEKLTRPLLTVTFDVD